MDTTDMPFFSQLKKYVDQNIDSWHTPGHCGGSSYLQSPHIHEFHEFMESNIFKSDLSVSVSELDSLLESKGVIKQSQDFAAKVFGADKTFYVTNGSSTSNKIILQSLLAPGDKIILDRSSHMSAHQGIFLTGAIPVYLNPSINEQYGLFGPIPESKIKETIINNQDAKVLFLTSCTYDGLRYNLKPIIELAHNYGIKVVIDEAWYAFAKFHPKFRPTALESGADYVTHSIHKVLSAFSQASMIHIGDENFDERRFLESYSIHTSSSPNYAIIASLDVAVHQVAKEGFHIIDRTLNLTNYFRAEVNNIPGMKVLGLDELLPNSIKEDSITLDPTKVMIDISCINLEVDYLKSILLNKFKIQIEKYTHNTLSVLFTVGATIEKTKRLIRALREVSSISPVFSRKSDSVSLPPKIPSPGKQVCTPKEAFYKKGEFISFLNDYGQINPELINRVSIDQIIPKPPGIPIIVPGQVIDSASLEYLRELSRTQQEIKVLGLRKSCISNNLGIQVLTKEEELELEINSEKIHSNTTNYLNKYIEQFA